MTRVRRGKRGEGGQEEGSKGITSLMTAWSGIKGGREGRREGGKEGGREGIYLLDDGLVGDESRGGHLPAGPLTRGC